ncbi:MAG: GrpB family protein [Solirubrobacterales bacterium]
MIWLWPKRFETERARLQEAIGSWAEGGIHHIGSTAVPELVAKPTVDILVGVGDLDSARACFASLAELDYLYAPYRLELMHWFCKPHPSRREFHLHLIPVSSARFRDELAFRDLLLRDPEVRSKFAALKLSLAELFPDDQEAYTDGKIPFIEQALAL